MTDRGDGCEETLRQRAEELLRSRIDRLEECTSEEIRTIVQELQVHKIELELQKEELLLTQQELEKTRRRYTRLYNNAPVGYVVLDKTGLILESNVTFNRMISDHEVQFKKGMPFAELLSNEDAAIFRARFKSFFKHPGGKRMEVQFDKGNSSFFGLLEAAPHQKVAPVEGKGEYDELLVTVTDITERRAAEKQLGDNREYLATTLNSIGDAVITTDSSGRVTAMNPVAQRLTGWAESEAIGKPLPSVFHIVNSRSMEIIENPVEKVLSEGRTKEVADDTLLLARDGAKYQIADSAAPIQKEGEEILGVVLVFRDVTEEYEMDRQIKESRYRLARAQEIAHLGSWELDLHAQTLVWSDEVFRILGCEPGEFVPTYESFLQWVHPDDRALVDEAYRNSIEKVADYYEVEHRIITKSGQVKTVHEKCEHIRNATGEIIRSQGMIHDITQRKQAEESLQKSEYEKRLVLDSTAEMFAYFDLDLRIRWANRAFSNSVGKTFEELIGKHCYQLWYKRSEPCPNCPVIKARDTGKMHKAETMTPDGRYWHMRGYPVFDENNHLVGLIEFTQDITSSTIATRSLAAEKERLAVTLRSIGDGVITTDIEGNVVIMNTVAEELTGWTQEQAYGNPLTTVFSIVHEYTRKPCGNPVEKVLSTGKIIELANHTMLIARDGTERIIADSGAPIKNEQGELLGVVLVFRDMTEKQRLLDTVNRADKLQSLGILAGGIAHDFNNLLGGIFGYLDMAREHSNTGSGKVVTYLDKALGAYKRAKDLTQQLLTFSKGGVPVRSPCDMKDLLSENASFALSGSNIKVRYKFPEDVWLCEVDENQIGQVINNVVLNAQQAMPLGGEIEISLENVTLEKKNADLQAGEYVRIAVADEGIGIQSELLKRIFDPFFTTKQKGNGLGLATSYSIIEKHDGTIEVTSLPGRGTTFYIYLPATPTAVLKKDTQQKIDYRGTGAVLIMDDEEFILDIAGEVLRGMGYETIGATNGEEALLQFDKSGAAVVAAILDLTIPGGMGGKETISRLRKTFPDLPVFASSGYSEDPVMASPEKFGFTDSIRKPYRKKDLEALFSKYLIGKR